MGQLLPQGAVYRCHLPEQRVPLRDDACYPSMTGHAIRDCNPVAPNNPRDALRVLFCF